MAAAAPQFAVDILAGGQPKQLTLVIPVEPGPSGRLLLGQKKRGFGAGYWNGFGGKVEPGETVLQAALRELHEEACITATSIEAVGLLTFVFDDNPQPWHVHVYRVDAFDGVPSETEEMRPQWFEQQDIPYDHMWADDVHWYPLFLARQRFKGIFAFRQTTQLVWFDVRQVQQLADGCWWEQQLPQQQATGPVTPGSEVSLA